MRLRTPRPKSALAVLYSKRGKRKSSSVGIKISWRRIRNVEPRKGRVQNVMRVSRSRGPEPEACRASFKWRSAYTVFVLKIRIVPVDQISTADYSQYGVTGADALIVG